MASAPEEDGTGWQTQPGRKKHKTANRNRNRNDLNSCEQLPANYNKPNRLKVNIESRANENEATGNALPRPSEQPNVPSKMGIRMLKKLLMKEPMEVLQVLANSKNGFEKLLNSSPIKPDMVVLIMKVICKACSTEFSEFKKGILILACGDLFLGELVKFMMNLPHDNSERNTAKQFLENFVEFCQIVMESLPNLGVEKLRNVLIEVSMNSKACVKYSKIVINQTFFDKLETLLNNMWFLTKRIEEDERNVNISEQYIPLPSENFRDIMVYPGHDDIHLRSPCLRKNTQKGSFQNVELYLDTQFRLLREDFISPLRTSIKEYIGIELKNIKTKFHSVSVYDKVRFLKSTTILNKVCYEVCFDVDDKIKNVKWEYSKKFMFGSFLLFGNNDFHNFFLGTVVNRELTDLQSKLISVDLVHNDDFKMSATDLMKQDFKMANSEVYFEPYFNVLNALKNLNSRNFPFERYIVLAKCNSSPPKYIEKNMDVIYNINICNPTTCMPKSFTFHPLGNDWPSPGDLFLDESQYTAFKSALTNEFVVIQGPPGTGKTYLGLRIAETLLVNKTIWNYPSSPILIVCFTNHALDQFLEGILPFTSNIIRVGGQSKNETLAPFNLHYKRISAINSNKQSPLLSDLRKKLTTMFHTIKVIQGKIEILDKNQGVVSLKTLRCILSKEFLKRNFNNQDEFLMDWLLDGVEQIGSKTSVILTNCGKVENVVISRDDDKIVVNEEFLDVMQFEEMGAKQDEAEVYYACTKNNIFNKAAEFTTVLENLSNSEMTVNEMNDKIKANKETIEDLKNIGDHLDANLKLSIDEVEDDLIKRLGEQKKVWSLSPRQRWILYHSWINKLKQEFMLKIAEHEEKYRMDINRYEEAKQMEDLDIIKEADIVGITTSTAAKLQAILGQLAPKIVIVEEAAEMMESYIIALLTSRCEHLILIGDLKQLGPKPANITFAKEFHLDVSLFERMINNGMSSNLLTTQYRMRPEMSKLLAPSIYSTLRDHTSVLNRKNIRGMEKNVFFFNHNNYEQQVDDIQSKKNRFEAKFLVSLARYLMLQGYKAEEITILTTYKGQMFEIKNEWKKYGLVSNLRITVVDDFQAEVNKIILLSLVRSNKYSKIGFLKIENRVSMALSRAKDGLYIVGNMDNLVAASTIWPKIKTILIDQEAYGPALVLRCEVHPKQLTRITSNKDFEHFIESASNQLYLQQLPCGHVCKSLCHVTNSELELNKCFESCNKLCFEGHPCKKKCFERCGECSELISRLLPCNHEVTIPCSTKVESYTCTKEIEVRFKSCNHTRLVACADKDNAVCQEPCLFRVGTCGHACKLTCHATDDPDHIEYECMKPCARKPLNCSQSHKCEHPCCKKCKQCTINVLKALDCGHQQRAPCYKKIVCEAMCTRTLSCGHRCKKKCKESCEPCMVMVSKVITECQHEMEVPCHEPAISVNCSEKCSKIMSCGHVCSQLCQDMCSPAYCTQPVVVEVDMPCGHTTAAVPCNLKDNVNSLNSAELLQYCTEPCSKMLDCEHLCRGTCGQCMQGRIHSSCGQPCGNTLICNHSCSVPCSQICPPCDKPCPLSCSHSKCSKKCGEVCTPCMEPCQNICPHYTCKRKCGEMCNRPPCNRPCPEVLHCGHPCVGFCGETCPPCKPCNPEDYEEWFYMGDETEPDARYVLLEDCKHTFEVNYLEQWLNVVPDNNEILLKVCPKCKTVIANVQRFQNIIKTVLNDIRAIKTKVFGEVEEIRAERVQLLEMLDDSSFTMSGFPTYNLDADEILKLHRSLQQDLQIIKNQRLNEYDLQMMILCKFMTNFILTIEKRLSDVWEKIETSSKTEIFNLVNFLISALIKRNKKVGKQEVNEFLLELNRLHRWIDLFLIESSVFFKQSSSIIVKVKYQEVKNKINTLNIYSDSLDKDIELSLKEVQEISKTVITDEERKMVHSAMAKDFYGGPGAKGHWFKCPNGHIYCITECGGAMQEAICPEKDCGARIGGQNHRYLPDQSLAPEMDGATHAAWSAQNDLLNYEL